jgi:hypothetical protein
MSKRDRRLLTIVLAAAMMTTGEGEGAAGGEGSSGEGEGGAGGAGGEGSGGEGGSVTDDLSTIFTPEDIQAKKDSIAAAQAEETRRAGLTEEQRTEEDRVKAEEAAKTQAPEAYADFTVPEGVVLDPVMMEEFLPMAKELELSQGKAQKLIDLAAKMQQRTIEGMFAQHEERKATWLKEAQADPEIGADIKLGADSATLRAFNTIAGTYPGIKAMVDELGIGNHPEFLRVFHALSKHMREDTFEIPGGGGGGETTSRAKALWPEMK